MRRPPGARPAPVACGANRFETGRRLCDSTARHAHAVRGRGEESRVARRCSMPLQWNEPAHEPTPRACPRPSTPFAHQCRRGLRRSRSNNVQPPSTAAAIAAITITAGAIAAAAVV